MVELRTPITRAKIQYTIPHCVQNRATTRDGRQYTACSDVMLNYVIFLEILTMKLLIIIILTHLRNERWTGCCIISLS